MICPTTNIVTKLMTSKKLSFVILLIWALIAAATTESRAQSTPSPVATEKVIPPTPQGSAITKYYI